MCPINGWQIILFLSSILNFLKIKLICSEYLSKLSSFVKNLFFCGEVIDVNAYTGGFNLQIAFSTGYLAGKSAGEKEI